MKEAITWRDVIPRHSYQRGQHDEKNRNFQTGAREPPVPERGASATSDDPSVSVCLSKGPKLSH